MNSLTTEQRNPLSNDIDQLSAREIVELMNKEDLNVAVAVGRQTQRISAAVELIASRLREGGRLFYLGAGTSGRLGVLDAAECPPTFSTDPGMVIGIIAGGAAALTRAIEGAEDDPKAAAEDLRIHNICSKDVLVGIATSGRTPYVIGGLHYARTQGASTVAMTCNERTDLSDCAEIVIAPIVGPEVISGSTRLKAGTATKMVLNMLTTSTMVLLGKTYGNLMVDLRATNSKLKSRSIGIVRALTEMDDQAAAELLFNCGGEVKTAVVSALRRVDAATARQMLQRAQGKLREAIHDHGHGPL